MSETEEKVQPTAMDAYMRKEIYAVLWRTFALMTKRVSITFDEDGINIRVPVSLDLGGPLIIYGFVRGHNEYVEQAIEQRRMTRP